MSEIKDREVIREPFDPAAPAQEVDEVFQFNTNLTPAQAADCKHIEDYARGLAFDIAALVPPGKCQTVAINGIFGAVLWARQGIAGARQVELVEAVQESSEPAPALVEGGCCCARDHNKDGNCDKHPA